MQKTSYHTSNIYVICRKGWHQHFLNDLQFLDYEGCTVSCRYLSQDKPNVDAFSRHIHKIFCVDFIWSHNSVTCYNKPIYMYWIWLFKIKAWFVAVITIRNFPQNTWKWLKWHVFNITGRVNTNCRNLTANSENAHSPSPSPSRCFDEGSILQDMDRTKSQIKKNWWIEIQLWN